ncbi:SusD family protein [Filimonas lacunae]|uniref:SusD family protein n=1 Tax=Filimonas lacunae TaxID=477680 RepID=A0A173MR07_9BACT|nr:RagB/SusD family nutrient uptake outer membrane protein [Filimonas lacunae]BAV10092.1 hypothetical protein FLA_6147 [Filimonas lacunae]SIS83896.1 SusD family protein [Filimonas lacunae]
MKTLYFTSIVLFLLTVAACKKQDEWLDVKLNKSDVIPKVEEDFQALLDNTNRMNASYPALGIVGCDNYYVSYSTWLAASLPIERMAYTWDENVYQGITPFDWGDASLMVAFANVALEGWEKAEKKNSAAWNNIRGSSLFFRSYAFYNMLQLFAPHYDSATAAVDLGIQLRLSSDVNQRVGRSSTGDCYKKVTDDLREALLYLPAYPFYQSRPGKQAVYALLARIYLDMEKYPAAVAYADSALQMGTSLYNFSTDINSAVNRPFPVYPKNKEVIFYAESAVYGIASPSGFRAIIDSALYQQYEANDIRRAAFFRVNNGLNYFKGTYTGSSYPFAGLAVNELYLIRSEANVRTGHNMAALKDLNDLISTRYKPGTYVAFSSDSGEDILKKVIQERRKEMPFTSLRWADLKRLNRDSRFAVTLYRKLNGSDYVLPPNDKRYVLPIPDEEIRLSGVPQNPR